MPVPGCFEEFLANSLPSVLNPCVLYAKVGKQCLPNYFGPL